MKKGFVLGLLLCTLCLTILSGDILLDEPPLKKGKVLLFKDHSNPNNFYYFFTEIRVASGPDGKPKVSFIKLRGQEGVLSFFLAHGLAPEKLEGLRQDLAEESPGTILKGPISFSKGKFYILNRRDGEPELWAEGKAPLFPNQEVVVTRKLREPFDLDVVAIFVMEYEGITQRYNANLSVNWDEVYIQREFSEKTLWTSMDIKEILVRLKESGTIKLEAMGDYGELSQIWNIASKHLIHQMFDIQEIKMSASPGEMALEDGHKNIVYALKKERKTGSYHIDFNRRFKDKRQIILISDIGDAVKKAIAELRIDSFSGVRRLRFSSFTT